MQYGNHYLPVSLSSIQNDGRTIYTCIASNEAGSAEQHYRINLLGTNLFELKDSRFNWAQFRKEILYYALDRSHTFNSL